MAKVSDLEIALRINSTLQADLNKAKAQISKFSSETSTGFSRLGELVKGAFGVNLAKLGTIAGVAALGTALSVATKKAVDFASEINDTARSLGVSVEALQELRFAAQLSGVSIASLDTALKFLNKNTSEAISGNTKIVDAFDRLGLSVRELQTMRPEQLFGAVIEQLGKVPTAAERTRLSMLLLGRSGSELGKLATESAAGIEALRQQARDLGVVLDEKTIRAADDLGDKFDALSTIMKVQMVESLLALTPLWDRMATSILDAARNLGLFFDEMNKAPALKKAEADVAALAATLEDLKASNILGILDSDITKLEGRLAAARAKSAEAWFQAQTQLPGVTPVDDGSGSGRDLNAARNRAAETAAAREMSTLRRKLITEEKAAEAELSAEIRRGLDEQMRSEELLVSTTERRLEAEAELAEALGQASVAEQKRAELSEARYQRERQLIAATIQDEADRAKALEELGAAHAAELGKVATEANKEFEHLKDFGINGLSDALADLALTGELTFKSLGESFLREFVQVAIKEGLAELAAAMASFSGGSGGGGFFSTVFGLLGLASGGVVTKPTIAMIGEAGPEAVIPLSRLGMGGGGGVEVHIHEAPGTKATATSRRGAGGNMRLDVAIKKMIADDFATGGPVSQSASQVFGLARRGERVG